MGVGGCGCAHYKHKDKTIDVVAPSSSDHKIVPECLLIPTRVPFNVDASKIGPLCTSTSFYGHVQNSTTASELVTHIPQYTHVIHNNE